MSDENMETKTKKRSEKSNRISLNAEALDRIEGWVRQLSDQFKGIRVTHSDIINWLVLDHGPALSNKELKEAKEQFFDDIALAAWALNQLKEAKAQGKTASLFDFIGHGLQQKGGNHGRTAKPDSRQVAGDRGAGE